MVFFPLSFSFLLYKFTGFTWAKREWQLLKALHLLEWAFGLPYKLNFLYDLETSAPDHI